MEYMTVLLYDEATRELLALTLLQSTIPSMAARGTNPSEKATTRDPLGTVWI